MRKLPAMKYGETPFQKQIVAFGGLNRTDNTKEGELAACENLSDRRYPFLTQRLPRKKVEGPAAATAIFSWDGKLIVVDGTSLFYDGEVVGTVEPGEKQFAVVNTKLVIWPDKKYLDLTDLKFGDLAAEVGMVSGTSAAFTENSVTLTGAFATDVSALYTHVIQFNVFSDGNLIKRYTAVDWDANGGWSLSGETEVNVDDFMTGSPAEIDEQLAVGDIVMLKKSEIEGNYQLSTRSYHNDLQTNTVTYGDYAPIDERGYYAVITGKSNTIDGEPGLTFFNQTVTFKIMNAGSDNLDLASTFAAGDRVQISGCTTIPANNTAAGTHLTVSAVTSNSLTFAGTPFTAGNETGTLKLERPVPDLSFICEAENRLWGVSNADKAIYASALGDPKNFYVYEGLSTDGYAVAVGSEGPFTGICRGASAVLCWKENSLHKVLGSFPAEYQMYTYQYAGVKGGCEKSMVSINEVLYYLGPDGIYAYTGDAPQLLSGAFGSHRYAQGAAGSDGEHYYLCAREGEEWSLLSFNTKTGFWLRQDDAHAVSFCRNAGVVYLLHSGGVIETLNDPTAEYPQGARPIRREAELPTTGQYPQGARPIRREAELPTAGQYPISWSAQLTPFRETLEGKKRYSRIFLRLEIPKGSWLEAAYRCDGGRWESAGKVVGKETGVVLLPVAPRRCDQFEIRLSGVGPCAVLQMLREFRVESAIES